MPETETAATIKPSDEALAFTFLGGLFFTVVATVLTESLLVLIGGTAITVAAIRIAVGDSEETEK
jgi:hypothetical protein